MRNLTKLTAAAAALTAVLAFGASNAHAEPSMDHSPTIQVDDGKGGWTPYEHQKPPAGPTGISIDTGNGWEPYNPPAKPAPVKPKSKHATVIKHVKRGQWTYWLMQDGATGALYINISDPDENRVTSLNGSEIPMPGGGPTYPVR